MFFDDVGGNFYGLDSATGQKLWRQDLGGAIGGGVTAGGAQKVAVAAGFTNITWPTKPVHGQGRRARPRQQVRSLVVELDPVFPVTVSSQHSALE